MLEPEGVIQDCKDAHVIALKEMMDCANGVRINNLDDVRQAQAFLTILQSYYKEQVEVVKAITEAGSIVSKKLKEYNGPKEESIEDL
jgi:hypothetical protein